MLTSGARDYFIPFVQGNPEVSGSPLSSGSRSKTALLQVLGVGLAGRKDGSSTAAPWPGQAAAHRHSRL